MVWDSQVAGLGVRVRPSGHRSFVWHGHANGAAVRVTVGSAALTTVGEARRECPMLQNGMELSGRNHRKDRLSVPFFQDFVMSEWWPAYQRRCARSSGRSVDQVLRRRLLPSFGRLRLNRIRRPEVERWFDAYSRTAPGGANKALQLLGQIMNSAVAAGHTDTNPTRGIRKNPRRKLTRFLSGEEIDRLHRTLDRLVAERPSRTRASRHHSPASPDRLPERRDPEAEMVRGRRPCTQAGGNQDRPTTGLVERSGAGHHRPPAAHGQRLCLPVPEMPGKTVFQRYGPVVPSEEGSRDR